MIDTPQPGSTPSEQPAPAGPLRKIVKRLALPLALLLAGALAGEMFLRLLGAHHYAGRFAPDAELGWRFAPASQFTYRAGGVANRVRIDALGRRSSGGENGERPRRMAIFGDAFAAALAVPAGESLAGRLVGLLSPGRQVAGHATEGWAAFNYGVSGYGTFQELRLYQRVAEPEGPFDLVLLAFRPQDDFQENFSADPWLAGARRPVLAVGGDASLPAGRAQPPRPATWLEELAEHSALASSLTASDPKRSAKRPPGHLPQNTLEDSKDEPSGLARATPDQQRTTANLLAGFRDQVHLRGGHFLVVLAPSTGELGPAEGTGAGVPPGEEEPRARFLRMLRERGVAYCDLYPIFNQAVAQADATSYFGPGQSGWSAAGNEIVARLLTPVAAGLERSGLVGPVGGSLGSVCDDSLSL